MLDSLFNTDTASSITLGNLLIALATALVLGFINSLVYLKIGRGKMPSQSFAMTLIVLPAVVAIIILLVGDNIARAFSLAGAFAIIRFRSVAGDPKDITYVLFSMAIGLACGLGFVVYAAVTAVLLCGVTAVLEHIGFGKANPSARQLKINVPENLDYHDALGGVLDKYALSHSLARVKTTELGSLYQLTYKVVLKSGVDEKLLIDELRCHNGNLNISLDLRAPDAQSDKV